MPKTVSLRLDDDSYRLFQRAAKDDNRPLSNFIETATKRYIEQRELTDESESAEIKSNKSLNQSIRRGHSEAAARRGRFVD